LPNLLNLKPNQQWISFFFSKLVRGQSTPAPTSPPCRMYGVLHKTLQYILFLSHTDQQAIFWTPLDNSNLDIGSYKQYL